MMRLLIADMRYHVSAWAGAFSVAVLCGCLGGWAVLLRAAADVVPGAAGKVLVAGAESIVMFSAVAAVVVLASVSRATVDVQRRSYALWQLAGMGPARVSAIVAGQVALVGLLGGIVGTLLAAVTLALPVGLLARLDPGLGAAPVSPTASALPAVWAGVAGVFFLGGLRGAVAAGRTPALGALRGEGRPGRRFTVLRAVCFAAAAACAGWLAAFSCSSVDNAMLGGVFVPVALAVALAAAAPIALPALVRALTAFVPQRFDAWYLARRFAAHGVAADTAIETPIMAASAIVSGFFSFLAAVLEYGRVHGQAVNVPDIVPIVFMLGGPVLVFVLGAAVGVAVAARSRANGAALLEALGASRALQERAVACEAFVHAAAASLAGAFCAAMASVVYARAFDIGPAAAFSAAPGIVVFVLGFLLVLVAALVPVRRALRGDIARGLAGEE